MHHGASDAKHPDSTPGSGMSSSKDSLAEPLVPEPTNHPKPARPSNLPAVVGLRVRQSAAKTLLARSLLLLLLNLVAIVTQAVCMDLAVRRDEDGRQTQYDDATASVFFAAWIQQYFACKATHK